MSWFSHFHIQVMMRAGQPLTGTNGRRCKEDEKLINATLRPGKRGYIIDTRTISVAQQAKARGGGLESEANYPQWRRIHKAVERWAAIYLDISVGSGYLTLDYLVELKRLVHLYSGTDKISCRVSVTYRGGQPKLHCILTFCLICSSLNILCWKVVHLKNIAAYKVIS